MGKSKALELSIQIAGKVDKSLMASITTAKNQVSGFSREMSRIGTVGLAAMGTAAAGTLMAISDCTKEAETFANGMGDVVKYVDSLADANGKINAKEYAEMSKAIRDLSTQIPYTQKEIQELAASAGQSGKKKNDLFQYDSKGMVSGFLKDVAIMGTAWDIEAATAGNWAAKWEVALNMTHDQVMELANQINYLGANNATTAAEIGEVVNKVASFGQVAGMIPSNTAALSTALLAMGVSGDVAASSVNRMYTNLNKGASATKAQKEMWKSMGMTAEGVALGMQQDAAGTLQEVFTAIKSLPKENQVAALSTLLGQWAIQAGGKLTNNLGAFTKALDQVQNPENYNNSMMREFIIKSDTPEAINTMLESSKAAIKGEIGESFLPAKKEIGLAMIDLIGTLRNDMPEIQQIAQTAGTLFSSGVERMGEAIENALPYIQGGLDYLLHNGPQVVTVLKGMAGAFVAMKFAPAMESLFKGASGLLFGTSPPGGGRGTSGGLLGAARGLWSGGQGFIGKAGGILGPAGEFLRASFRDARQDGAANVLLGLMGETKLGGYFGGIKTSFGDLLNTRIGGGIASAITSTGGAAKEILSGISQATGLTDLVKGGVGLAKNGAGWLAGKGGGLLSAIAGSAPGKALGGAASAIGNFGGSTLSQLFSFASAGGGLLGSVWGPMASGFGGLFAGAAPVIGAISGIIAVVGILGDHLEDIRGIVGSVFGEGGLAVFDTFTGKLREAGNFISGLFGEGGVANAMAPLRKNIVGLFGPEAGAAFDGLTTILQSVMGVVGQIVAFSDSTVKPIIEDIFSFITGTVAPILLQTFTDAAPAIAAIIDGLGTGIMAGVQAIGAGITAVMPIIKGLITAFLHIGSVVVPAVLEGVAVFASGIGNIMTSIQGFFNGLITFVTGVFSGNWGQAWEGIKQIFGNAFDALVELCKTPINAVVGIINGVISRINGMGFTIPEWVPVIGGNNFTVDLPTLPTFARGGFTNGPSIAGEAGREAVISFASGVRRQNIDTWARAGQMLGIPSLVELRKIGGGKSGGGGITFAPTIIIQGNADKNVVDEALTEAEARFRAWYEDMVRDHRRKDY